MDNKQEEIYKQFRTHQDKYAYFILAVSASAIAFSVQKTDNLLLEWSLLPLGLAVICWGYSFFCGCQFLRYIGSTLFANFELLKVQQGQHKELCKTPQHMQAASEGIKDGIKHNSKKTKTLGINQFRFLIAGAIFFITWHITEMIIRSI